MPNPKFHFLIPDVDAFVSGGNIYNKKLLSALNDLGIKTVISNLETFSNIANSSVANYFFVDSLFLFDFYKVVKNKQFTVKRYLIVHHLESLYPPKEIDSKKYFSQIELPILKRFDGFVTSSQFTADYLTKNGLFQPKIIVPPALEINTIPIPIRPAYPIHALIVANIVQRKGILPFLKAINELDLSSFKNKLKITIIGSTQLEPSYANECLQLMKEAPALSKIVVFKGELSPEEVQKNFLASNLFISCSFMETYGMAIQEARAFQIPILALKGGNIGNHIQPNKTGWIMDDMNALIVQMKQLIDYPSYHDKMIQQLMKKEKDIFYSWEEAAKCFMEQLFQ